MSNEGCSPLKAIPTLAYYFSFLNHKVNISIQTFKNQKQKRTKWFCFLISIFSFSFIFMFVGGLLDGCNICKKKKNICLNKNQYKLLLRIISIYLSVFVQYIYKHMTWCNFFLYILHEKKIRIVCFLLVSIYVRGATFTWK